MSPTLRPAGQTGSASQHAAQNAYGQSTREIASDRDVETTLFRRATTRLIHIMAEHPDGDLPVTPDNVSVLSDNLRLWDALCVDLMHPENQLPDELRNSLINLGNFVRQHTLRLYAGDGEVAVLVDINKAILGGLTGQAKPAEAAA